MAEPVGVGLVGCGAISSAYLKMAQRLPGIRVAACADLDTERARARAGEFGIPRVLSVAELLADAEVQVVLNLTVPNAHAPIALRALANGKHVFMEKPLGISREEGEQVLRSAAQNGLRVGCAPDTVLGSGLQTARKVIDDGGIGRPVAFAAAMMCPGHEHWHPSPEFYYEAGGGPMLDMGPYYLTALLNLLGPAARLSGMATTAIPERTITSQPKHGTKITVETPDHIAGTLLFENGAMGTLVTSFAAMHPVHDRAHPITIWGDEGAIKVPDPNGFDGTVFVRRREDEEWSEVPHAFVEGYRRAIGLAEMASAISAGRPHRLSAEQAFCVLDLMQGFLDSAAAGRAYEPASRYQRPAPMPRGLPYGVLD